jgi:hypothetical protein
MNAEAIASALSPRPVRSRRGFLVPCPAHQDLRASLSVCDAGAGRVLVHCFAGCPGESVWAELRRRGLIPERRERAFTPAERVEWGRRRRAAELVAAECSAWAHGEQLALERAKRATFDDGDFDGFAMAAAGLYRLQSARPEALLELYRAARAADPHAAAASVARGRAEALFNERLTAAVVGVLAAAEVRGRVDDES